MRVPAAERDRHHPHAGFHQPARHQEVVHAARWAVVLVLHVADAVPGPQPGIFAAQVEGLEHPSRGQNLERLWVKASIPFMASEWSKAAAQVVELAEQGTPAGQPIGDDRPLVEAQPRRAAAELRPAWRLARSGRA